MPNLVLSGENSLNATPETWSENWRMYSQHRRTHGDYSMKSHICFIFKKIKYSILYSATVSNGPSCICEFPFTSQTRTHDFTSISAGQACSSSLPAGLQSSILCSPLQRQRYSVIAVHNGLFQNASNTMHIKKTHIFHLSITDF